MTEKPKFIPFWIKPYKLYSVIAIFVAVIVNFAFARTAESGLRSFAIISVPLLLFGILRLYQYFRHENRRAHLFQHPAAIEKVDKIHDLVAAQEKEDQIFIGYGFEWEQTHSQGLREVVTRNLDDLMPPEFVLNARKKLGLVNDRNMKGRAYLHGIGFHEERPLFIDAADLGTHTYIGATTGAGKSQLYSVLVDQFIERNEAVIVLDPKGDDNLRDTLYSSLKRQGKEHKFNYFSPSFYENSVRINPFKSWTRSSQLADRLSSILPGGGDSETFKQFANQHLAVLYDAILYCGDSPSLKSTKRYCSGGIDSLVTKVCKKLFTDRHAEYPFAETDIKKKVLQFIKLGHEGASAEALAYAGYYESKVKEEHLVPEVTSLIGIFRKDKSNYDKLIYSLMPLLQKIATGYVGELLSPDYDCNEDERPIVDFQGICEKGEVIYINLESLADGESAAAIGALFLSDLTSTAAARYLFNKKDIAVNLFIDEAAELVNAPTVQLLNKSRGALFRCFLASQTTSDFTVRMGDDANTQMILGNTNNKFYGRLKNNDTAEIASAEMCKTMISTLEDRLATTGNPAGDEMDYGGGYGRTKKQEFAAKVEPDQFLKIPDLEFFASMADGKTLKLRIPFIPPVHNYDLSDDKHRYQVPRAA